MNSEQKPSFKDRLNQDADNQPTPSNDTHHIARESGNIPNISFITKTNGYAFAYSYLIFTNINFETGSIEMNFTCGLVEIKGKNLKKLFIDLKRNKVAEIDINNEDIDDITITLHGE